MNLKRKKLKNKNVDKINKQDTKKQNKNISKILLKFK